MLRARLFLSWVPFVAILIGVGVYAITLFSRLANQVDVTVMQNYRSATAAQSMDLALSSMKNGLHFVLEGDKVSGTSAFEENARVFEANLAVLTTNKYLFQESKLIGQWHTNYHDFQQA